MKIKLLHFFKFQQTSAGKDLPILASLAMGVCIFTGILTHQIQAGMTAASAALIVLYFPIHGSLRSRGFALLSCSAGFILSYTAGVVFSFNPIISVIVFGFMSMIIHYFVLEMKIKKPRSFFFIMLCATASNMPHTDIPHIAQNIGYLTFGAITTSIIALIYSVFNQSDTMNVNTSFPERKGRNNLAESILFGVFMSLSFGIGHLLEVNNPYWISIACLAVMQGVSTTHVLERSLQRIVGTLIGVLLCTVLLHFASSYLIVGIFIVLLQFIVEFVVPRNYAVAMIFITPLTIFLSETARLATDQNALFVFSRLANTILGSIIGLIGGWLIYQESIHHRFDKLTKRKTGHH